MMKPTLFAARAALVGVLRIRGHGAATKRAAHIVAAIADHRPRGHDGLHAIHVGGKIPHAATRSSLPAHPTLAVDCIPGTGSHPSKGRFLAANLLVGITLKIVYVEPEEIHGTSYYPKVAVQFRANDAKEDEEKWSVGAEKTSASIPKDSLKTILRARSIAITADDDHGSPVAMQFDMPDRRSSKTVAMSMSTRGRNAPGELGGAMKNSRRGFLMAAAGTSLAGITAGPAWAASGAAAAATTSTSPVSGESVQVASHEMPRGLTLLSIRSEHGDTLGVKTEHGILDVRRAALQLHLPVPPDARRLTAGRGCCGPAAPHRRGARTPRHDSLYLDEAQITHGPAFHQARQDRVHRTGINPRACQGSGREGTGGPDPFQQVQ